MEWWSIEKYQISSTKSQGVREEKKLKPETHNTGKAMQP
jgi:hypothetical protein